VRGTVWVAEQLTAEAERQVREQRSPRRRLLEAERQLELGLLTLDEYEAIEEDALDALEQDEEGRWRT
ncbi:MAG TPA: gas vesicle protein GvpG, partial [Gaiellaceae bacterium]|nr:gas vesicle protein GvpG [Gaiellaceae bacterium]